ncbi:hypothetical protein Tco_1023624 [Tanacetum coccineum]
MKVDEKNAANYQQGFEVSGNFSSHAPSKFFDADGHPKRTWTLWTASAHIITAVIGSGVLALAMGDCSAWLDRRTYRSISFSFCNLLLFLSSSLCYRTGDPNETIRTWKLSSPILV